MASSNRHWPSLFKSKSCTSHHQWHHDINSSLMSTGCNKPPCTSATCEERSPEPKQRWNPRPEQIRILEAIFNSGMVNPPRDEIRKIRIKLQEYGQVGDANVFYWFQNRKSRSKNKAQRAYTKTSSSSSSSSSSSRKSSSNSAGSTNNNNNNNNNVIDQFQQTYNNNNNNYDFNNMADQTLFFPQGFCFPHHEISAEYDVPNSSSGLFLSELMGISQNSPTFKKAEIEKMNFQPQVNYTPTVSHIQGVGDQRKATVFINDVAFEVPAGLPFNVSEVFGEDALLIQSYTGQPLVTNEWGLTIHPLQHGASYYLLHSSTP